MTLRLPGIPDYRRLDATGEGEKAALRMENRSREPASLAMFETLVKPLIGPQTLRVLEWGCGSGAIARRMARAFPQLHVLACDKSEVMLGAASAFAAAEELKNISFEQWDVTKDKTFAGGKFDLIFSSVAVPYLSDEETTAAVKRLKSLLMDGGTLAFLEQDLLTDSVAIPDFDLFRRIFARDERKLKRSLARGLRPILREAGLVIESKAPFLWTETHYGPYLRDLLGKAADDSLKAGKISADDRKRWNDTLELLAAKGDFYYGIVYHLIVGRLPDAG